MDASARGYILDPGRSGGAAWFVERPEQCSDHGLHSAGDGGVGQGCAFRIKRLGSRSLERGLVAGGDVFGTFDLPQADAAGASATIGDRLAAAAGVAPTRSHGRIVFAAVSYSTARYRARSLSRMDRPSHGIG